MNKYLVLLLFLITVRIGYAQNSSRKFNLDFEQGIFSKFKIPDSWFIWGNGYNVFQDTSEKHSGKVCIYMSPSDNKTEDSFGCIAQSIPANFDGISIKASVFVKYENVRDGYVGLLLRIDSESEIIAFDNMERDSIHGTSDWRKLTVSLDYPKNAKTIYLGAILSGNGKVWVDDFDITIDDKNINDIVLDEKFDNKAELDIEFDFDSKIIQYNIEKIDLDNLYIVGKVWGFLKYYHPEVRKGKFNWDYELFRIVSRITAVKSKSVRDSILLNWIDSLGEIKEMYQENDTTGICIKPNFNWITSSDVGKELQQMLFKIIRAQRDNNSYYVSLKKDVGNPIFTNEKSYPSIKYPDCGYRLLCLFRYWNMIEYYFPYKDLMGEDWEDVLKKYIPKFINSKSELEYKLNILSLISKIHDSHANLWGQDNVLANFKGLNATPLEVEFIENKVVVVGYYNDSIGINTTIKVGDIIQKINGKSVDDIANEKIDITSGSNYTVQQRDISSELLRTNDSILAIEFIQNDTVKYKILPCFRYRELIMNSENRDTCFKILQGNISYLNPKYLKPYYLSKILPIIDKTNGLIIDLRCYPSEFIVNSLGNFLLPEIRPFAKFLRGSTLLPGSFSFTDFIEVGRKNPFFFKGKVIILVNDQTQSQAEYTVMALRLAPNAKVIGSTTAGADGNISEINLPGGIKTTISGIGVFYPDGRPTQRIGILPDIEVKKTIYGVKTGKDEILECAISEIIKK